MVGCSLAIPMNECLFLNMVMVGGLTPPSNPFPCWALPPLPIDTAPHRSV
nr:hypothetical protein Q903MT_gene5249 [Picea sitchensis]